MIGALGRMQLCRTFWKNGEDYEFVSRDPMHIVSYAIVSHMRHKFLRNCVAFKKHFHFKYEIMSHATYFPNN